MAILALFLSKSNGIHVEQDKKHFISYQGGQMFQSSLKMYDSASIKQRLSDLDSQLTQYDLTKEEPSEDNIFAMMPTVSHKSDADYMEQIESRSQELQKVDQDKKDLEKEMEMLQLEKQRRLVKHHEVNEKKKKK